jgi:hypothetical protein
MKINQEKFIFNLLGGLIFFSPITIIIFLIINTSSVENNPTQQKKELPNGVLWAGKNVDLTQFYEGEKIGCRIAYTIVYDSCQYIVGSGNRTHTVTHKGNCKYCELRKKQQKTQ